MDRRPVRDKKAVSLHTSRSGYHHLKLEGCSSLRGQPFPSSARRGTRSPRGRRGSEQTAPFPDPYGHPKEVPIASLCPRAPPRAPPIDPPVQPGERPRPLRAHAKRRNSSISKNLRLAPYPSCDHAPRAIPIFGLARPRPAFRV